MSLPKKTRIKPSPKKATSQSTNPPTKMFTTKSGASIPEAAVQEDTGGKISWLSQFKFIMMLRSGWWAGFLAWFASYFVMLLASWLFGWGTGWYDMSDIAPVFKAGSVVLLLNAFVHFLLYMDYRTIHRYIYGKHKSEDGIRINFSKADFKAITSWQRLLLVTFLVCFYVVVFVLVYLKLVAPTPIQLPS